VTIDTEGEWWTGTDYQDVVAYLAELQPGGYPVDRVIQARCRCGSTTFQLLVDRDDELAKTICSSCGLETYVADSEKLWVDAKPEEIDCPCGHAIFEIGLGLCVRDEEWVRWGSLGIRCAKCGILASPIDWKSDLGLTDPAATRVAGGASAA
jgi:hypothetical protein